MPAWFYLPSFLWGSAMLTYYNYFDQINAAIAAAAAAAGANPCGGSCVPR